MIPAFTINVDNLKDYRGKRSGSKMETGWGAEDIETGARYDPQDHPWVEMPGFDSVDEEIRYSLDEIRIA